MSSIAHESDDGTRAMRIAFMDLSAEAKSNFIEILSKAKAGFDTFYGVDYYF